MACVFQNAAEKKQRRKENAGFMEYRTHFALWCLFGVPLMMDCDLRTVNETSKALMLNIELSPSIRTRSAVRLIWPENPVRIRISSSGICPTMNLYWLTSI